MRTTQVLRRLAGRIASAFGYSHAVAWEDVLAKQRFCRITQTEPQDVFVVGYPKSGNTWMQQLMSGVLYGIDTRYLPDRLSQEIVPDMHAKRYYKRFGDVCFFKTHHLPRPEYRRVVHLVRDGRDVMASYHAYLRNRGRSVPLEDMIVEGCGLSPCKWHEHGWQWLQNPYGADILRVRYEDLQENPFRELKRICAFAQIERADDVLRRAIEGCSFQEMQRKEREFGWNDKEWPKDKKFVRRGKVGGYKDEMSKDLVRLFEAEARGCLEEFGYSDVLVST